MKFSEAIEEVIKGKSITRISDKDWLISFKDTDFNYSKIGQSPLSRLTKEEILAEDWIITE